MTEKNIYSKQKIKEALGLLGVPQNRPVAVHCSLRAVGQTEGRGEGFLSALIEYVTADGGLLCVPAHTWHRCGGADMLTLDISSDDVCTGTLSKIASVYPGVHRSANPTHSLAVFGDFSRAERFIEHDEHISSSSDPSGCLGQLLREDGYILLIGVGQEKNTFIHMLEEKYGVKNRLSPWLYPASVKYPDGKTEVRPIHLIAPEGIGDVSKRYPKFERAFYYGGAIGYGFLCDARTQLCGAKAMNEVFGKIMKKYDGRELLADDEAIFPFPGE